MNEIIRAEQAELTTQKGLTADLYTRFVAFIDAKPAMLIVRNAASVPPEIITSASSRTIA